VLSYPLLFFHFFSSLGLPPLEDLQPTNRRNPPSTFLFFCVLAVRAAEGRRFFFFLIFKRSSPPPESPVRWTFILLGCECFAVKPCFRLLTFLLVGPIEELIVPPAWPLRVCYFFPSAVPSRTLLNQLLRLLFSPLVTPVPSGFSVSYNCGVAPTKPIHFFLDALFPNLPSWKIMYSSPASVCSSPLFMVAPS